MKFEKTRTTFSTPRATAVGLSIIALGGASAGCSDFEIAYEKPIRVPDNARYLGIHEDENRSSEQAGKSFLMHVEDVPYTDCGASREVIENSAGLDTVITKEVRVLKSGMAKVTCRGALQEEFPVVTFTSRYPGPTN
jgi:hypothetical protein